MTERLPGILENAFPILATQPEGLPLDLSSKFGKLPFQVLPTLAQKVPISGRVMWLVPGKTGICLLTQVEQGLGSVCQTTQRSVSVGISLTLLDEGRTSTGKSRRLIAGIAPTPVKEMLVQTQGHFSNIPVEALGVFILRDQADDPPDVVLPAD